MLTVNSPYSGDIVAQVPLLAPSDLDSVVEMAKKAQREIASWTLEQRLALCEAWLGAFEARSAELAADVTHQMGKPLTQALGEVRGSIDRARGMMALAPEALADDVLPAKAGFVRKITREPVGVVLAIAAWNYPLLIAVNAVIPGVLAGNAVLLKHSERSPLCGNAFAETFAAAGAPAGLVQSVHSEHHVTAKLVAHPGVDYTVFTGSVRGGHAVRRAAADRFIDVATELGGKDPAYVRADADLDFTVPNLVEGATYNAGQSCCAIERIYVHESLYNDVVSRAHEAVAALRMGDPMSDGVDVGPIAQEGHPDFLSGQIADARAKGARVLVGGSACAVNEKGRFFQPTVVADATHDMAVMREESFGPIVALASVGSDEEALQLMNDSQYGLTASIWTRDVECATQLARHVETGTVFMNRCDALDPMLPWTGQKDSGRAISLSKYGFGPLTRLKSYHFRVSF